MFKQVKSAHKKGKANLALYSTWHTKLADYFDSDRYYLTKDYLKPNSTILDIGCATGGLGQVIRAEIEPTVRYTGVDPLDTGF